MSERRTRRDLPIKLPVISGVAVVLIGLWIMSWRDHRGWIAVLLLVVASVVASVVRFWLRGGVAEFHQFRDETGPGMFSDFVDDMRRRPRRSEAWAKSHWPVDKRTPNPVDPDDLR